jgi:hypothetical protein
MHRSMNASVRARACADKLSGAVVDPLSEIVVDDFQQERAITPRNQVWATLERLNAMTVLALAEVATPGLGALAPPR